MSKLVFVSREVRLGLIDLEVYFIPAPSALELELYIEHAVLLFALNLHCIFLIDQAVNLFTKLTVQLNYKRSQVLYSLKYLCCIQLLKIFHVHETHRKLNIGLFF